MGERFYTYDPATKAKRVMEADSEDALIGMGLVTSRDKAKMEQYVAGLAVPEPATPPVGEAPAAPPPPVAAKGYLEQLADRAAGFGRSAGSYVAETAADTVRGVGRGLTFDAMAPAAALGASMAPVDDGTGIPRQYAAGSAEADIARQYRREDSEAQRRSPIATGVGRGLGTAAVMAPLAAAAVPAASGAAVTGAGMAAEAAMPAVAAGVLSRGGAAIDPEKSTGQWISETADPNAMALDATIGLAVPAGASAVREAAAWVAPPLRSAGQYLRGKAVGEGQLDPEGKRMLAQQFGTERGAATTAELGRRAEALDLPAAKPRPMGKGDYVDAASDKADELGQAFGEILDRNAALGVEVPKADVIRQLTALRTKYQKFPGDDKTAMARKVERAIEDLKTGQGFAGKDALTVRDLHTLKTTAQKEGGYRSGEGPSPPSRLASKEAARALASRYKGKMDQAMDDMAIRDDLPEFHRLNQSIQDARTIQGVARGAEGRSDMTGATARGTWNPFRSAIDTALPYAADAGAGAARATSGRLARVGNWTPNTALATVPPATVGNRDALMDLSQRRSLPRGAHPQLPPPPMPAGPGPSRMPAPALPVAAPQEPVPQPPTTQAPARVPATPAAVQQVLRQDPGAFGALTPEVQSAMESGDDEQINAALYKINSDPRLRARLNHTGG